VCSLTATLQVLQLAAHLRRAGYFVLAALTLPFDFEGRRKVEEASALVEALQDVANLVVRKGRRGGTVTADGAPVQPACEQRS
jgi:cell division GTPase FtsZ